MTTSTTRPSWMTETEQLRIALSDAYYLAEGKQKDALSRGQYDTHFHTLRLAAACTKHGPRFVIVALLHSVWSPNGGHALEDFPADIQVSVDAVTPIHGESWREYLRRAEADHVAKRVLIEHLKLRLETEGRESLRVRYRAALGLLEGGEEIPW